MIKTKILLSKLTVFDAMILTLLAGGIVFFAYFFFRKPDYKVVTIKLNEDSVRYEPWMANVGNRVWFSELFVEGLQEKNGLGKITAEILDVYSYDTAPDRKDVYIKTKLSSTFSRATNQYTYKGKPLIAGTLLKINFSDVYAEGMITQVEGMPDPRQKIKLEVTAQLKDENGTYLETSGVSPALADAIEKDKIVKDNNGNTIISVTDVQTEDAKKLTQGIYGNVHIERNPLRKDVILKMEINGLLIDNKYYMFDDIPILIGEKIPLNTSYYSVFPIVTDIKTLDE